MTATYERATPDEAYQPARAPGTGCVSLFFLVLFTPGALMATGAIGGNYGGTAFIVAGVVLGITWLMWVVTLIRRTRARRSEITGLDVLRTVLDFDLPAEYYNVGLTVFFRPDSIAAGEKTTLLIFAQNYANRPRRLTLKVYAHRHLGFEGPEIFRWELSPGQAVVYRRCMQVPADAPGGDYEGIVKVSVKFPKGEGARLIPRQRRAGGITVTRIRTAVFGLHVVDPVFSDNAVRGLEECPAPEFKSLYTPALQEPRFEVLQALTNGS